LKIGGNGRFGCIEVELGGKDDNDHACIVTINEGGGEISTRGCSNSLEGCSNSLDSCTGDVTMVAKMGEVELYCCNHKSSPRAMIDT